MITPEAAKQLIKKRSAVLGAVRCNLLPARGICAQSGKSRRRDVEIVQRDAR